MAKASFFLLILALATVCAQAQNATDVKATLEKNGFKSAVALLDAANMTTVLDEPLGIYTLLVPTDAAIADFLKKMGLTVADLKSRPALARQLLAQHIINKANVRPQELFANSSARVVDTLARKPNHLVFKKGAAGNVTVTDVRGHTANVKTPITIDSRKTLHPIDTVLLPDSIFYDWADLCKSRTLTLSEFCSALVYADLLSTVEGKNFTNTVFVPNNKAFAKALQLGGGVVPSVSRTQDVLKYHVVPGVRELPKGFKSGESIPTLLKGENLTIEYEVVKPTADDAWKLPYTVVTVVPTSGEKVPVVKANVFVGKSVAHGIEDLLIPGANKAEEAAAATAEPEPKAAAGAKPKAAAAGKPKAAAAGKPKAAAGAKPKPAAGAKPKAAAAEPKAAAAEPTPAAAAEAAAEPTPAAAEAAAEPTPASEAAAAPAGPGRRLFSTYSAVIRHRSRSLLDFGWGMSGGPTAEMDAAQGAIQQAADGYQTPFDAAEESMQGAEDLSVPGAYNLVDEGVTPW